MKHMKKLLALMLALLMVFAMVACDAEPGTADNNESPKTNAGAEASDADVAENVDGIDNSETENADTATRTPEEVVQTYADAFESGKLSDTAPLYHAALAEAEGLTEEAFFEAEKNWATAGFQCSIEVYDAEDLDEDELDTLKTVYAGEHGLEVEEAQKFAADVTLEYEEESNTDSAYFYVVKIDGEWYLHSGEV